MTAEEGSLSESKLPLLPTQRETVVESGDGSKRWEKKRVLDECKIWVDDQVSKRPGGKRVSG